LNRKKATISSHLIASHRITWRFVSFCFVSVRGDGFVDSFPKKADWILDRSIVRLMDASTDVWTIRCFDLVFPRVDNETVDGMEWNEIKLIGVVATVTPPEVADCEAAAM
jgi:hypothetical protein